MNINELKSVAQAIVAKQKGVLAADESSPTIKKRFDTIKVESTEEKRRRYREILFTTQGIERNIGGVILFEETLRQSTQDGIPFARLLANCGIIPGIKVDKGAKALALYPGDKIAEGLARFIFWITRQTHPVASSLLSPCKIIRCSMLLSACCTQAMEACM